LGAARLAAQLKEAELQALRMQLHPHFLFNALHSVTALVLKNENKEAVRMINRLSELLRFAIRDNETHWVPLKQEVQFLDRYLEIEQIRFRDRLTVSMSIETETLNAEIPNFILQPLVENAIRHGIAMQSSAGTVTLTAIRKNGALYLEVRDDGPGLPVNWKQLGKDGVGLRNTRARLEQLYGSEYVFDLSNGKERGAVAALTIPFRMANQEPAEGEPQS
jgi:LytS/YehU family sensor histidine kinase